MLATLRRLITRLQAAHPAVLALGIAVVSAAYRVVLLLEAGDGTFDMLIKGAPRNDAFRWDAMAADFARGDGWDGSWGAHDTSRPLYWVVMGSIYALTGSSLGSRCGWFRLPGPARSAFPAGSPSRTGWESRR